MIAALDPSERLPSHVMSVAKFERLFRVAAGLDIDKQDLKRYSEFINQKVYDLVVCGEATATLNGHRSIEPVDLPITKGLQACIKEFVAFDERIELAPILDRLTARPPLGRPLDKATEKQLPEIVGGISFALARAFKIIDPDLKNPQTEHWERSFRLFALLL